MSMAQLPVGDRYDSLWLVFCRSFEMDDMLDESVARYGLRSCPIRHHDLLVVHGRQGLSCSLWWWWRRKGTSVTTRVLETRNASRQTHCITVHTRWEKLLNVDTVSMLAPQLVS